MNVRRRKALGEQRLGLIGLEQHAFEFALFHLVLKGIHLNPAADASGLLAAPDPAWPADAHISKPRIACEARAERWPRNFGRDDKWNFCLTTGTLVPANQERQ